MINKLIALEKGNASNSKGLDIALAVNTIDEAVSRPNPVETKTVHNSLIVAMETLITSAPAYPPFYFGQTAIDKVMNKVYFATGTGNVSNWVAIN